MANYPPPPGGGWTPPAGGPDPHAADRALAEWAQARGVQLSPQGDVRWYQAWAPFAFLYPIARVGREARQIVGEAAVSVVETFEGDAIKQATGEDRHLIAFVMSPRLAYRAAVRSRLGAAGFVDDVSRGFGEISKGLEGLFGSKKPEPQTLLGDPAFESRFEVAGPTRDETHAALTTPLRQLLLQGGFRGILETRPQGLVVTFHDRPQFDPQSLDGTLAWVGQIYRAAIQYPHVVTP